MSEERTNKHTRDSISRQDACRTLFDDCHIKIMSGNNWIRLEEAVAKLSALPSAQPEVICCKDCKWFGNIGCAISIADDSDKPTENDFCSFAERRTDG